MIKTFFHFFSSDDDKSRSGPELEDELYECIGKFMLGK